MYTISTPLMLCMILINAQLCPQDVARRCDERRRSSDGARRPPRSPEALAYAVAATARWTAKTIRNIHASHA